VTVLLPNGRKRGQKGLLGHPDNMSSHRSGATQTFFNQSPLKTVDHHPDSPNIASSGHYLFRRVKAGLTGQYLSDGRELFEAIMEKRDVYRPLN
jgi:hypothetical protein